MSKFKVGDIVKWSEYTYEPSYESAVCGGMPDHIGVVKSVHTYAIIVMPKNNPSHDGWTFLEEQLTLVDRHISLYEENDSCRISSSFDPGNVLKAKSKIMDLTEKLMLAITPEPKKTFIKLGIVDSSGKLNSEGRELFTHWFFTKNQDDFNKEVCDSLLAEQEKNK